MAQIHCIYQHDSNDCGPACISTICSYYGKKIPIAIIKQYAKTNLEGTSGKGMKIALAKLGLASRGKLLTTIDDNEKETLLLPCIACLKNTSSSLHFVIIYKISHKYLYVCDPLKGKRKILRESFPIEFTGHILEVIPTEKFEKNKNYYSTSFHVFKKLFNSELKLTLLIFFLSLIVTLLSILSILYNKILFDNIIPNGLSAQLPKIFITFASIIIISNIFSFMRQYFIFQYSKRLDEKLLLNLYKKTILLPFDFFANRQAGDILSRFDDAISIRETLSTVCISLIMDVVLSIGAGFILCYMNRTLFILTLFPILIYAFTVIVFRKIITRLNYENMKYNASLNSLLIEMISGIELIKSFCIENAFIHKITDNFKKMLSKGTKVACTISLQITNQEIVSHIFTLLVLTLGSYYIISQHMSIGTLMTFNTLLVYFFNPIEKILQLQNNFQKSIIAINRLTEIIELPTEFNNEEEIESIINGDIVIENLQFGYNTKYNVFENLNLIIPHNKKVAIIGKSGSGKTTLIRLIMRLYNYEKGHIYINHKNIIDFNKQSLRKIIGYVGQDSFFFSGSILENINLHHQNSMERVIEVCKMVKIHDFISSLPNTYMSQISENGRNFSAGQKQRLSLARAILLNPKILILDEATSNLDVETELEIDSVLSKLTSQMTVIMIAHRLSTISRCDQILFLENGQLVEHGSHEELLRLNKRYHELWIKREVIK